MDFGNLRSIRGRRQPSDSNRVWRIVRSPLQLQCSGSTLPEEEVPRRQIRASRRSRRRSPFAIDSGHSLHRPPRAIRHRRGNRTLRRLSVGRRRVGDLARGRKISSDRARGPRGSSRRGPSLPLTGCGLPVRGCLPLPSRLGIGLRYSNAQKTTTSENETADQ